jgi:hypothetical protein
MPGTRKLLALALAAAAVLGAAVPASGDARQDREQIRREQAAVAADLDVLEAQDVEIAAALEVLATNLVVEGAALEAAREESIRTAAVLAEARAVEAATRLELEVRRDQVEALAVLAYMGTGTDEALGAALDANTPLEASHRLTLADSGAAQLRDAVDALEAAEAAASDARRAADAAAEAAEDVQAEVEGRVVALQVAQQQHAALAADVAARIEQRRAEALTLDAAADELSAQILAEEAALVARSGGSLAPPPLARVGVFTVHEALADDLADLLAAAEDDGIDLGGWGYRDSAAQWNLRVAHCPDPVSSPSSACSPPTAPVGSSMHERGLAIDFTCAGGQSIGTHASPCYQWLAAHAEAYGLYNLPSEPWHWSVTGN